MTIYSRAIAAAALCLGLAACGAPSMRSDNAVSPSAPGVAPSGVTSSNGGGQRTTGGINNVTLGTSGGAAGSPSTRGAAY